MKERIVIGLWTLSLLFVAALPGTAADLYLGDSAIYGAGGSIDLRPNVLFIVDNSQFMAQGAAGTPYDPDTIYNGSYIPNAVYRRLSATGGTINYDDPNSPFIDASSTDADGDGYGDLEDLACDEAESILSQTSYYTGPLLSNGNCRGQTGFYYTGNLLNYITNPPSGEAWAPSTEYEVGDYVQVTDTVTNAVVYYEAVTAGNSGGSGSEPEWGTEDPGDTLADGSGLTWRRAGSVMNMVQDAIELVVSAARDKAKFGLMVFGANNQGGRLLASVDKMGSGDTVSDDGIDGDSSLTNFLAKVESLDDDTVLESANSNQKINEALWDAKQYFESNYNSSSDRFGTDVSTELADLNSVDTPVECPDIQPNFVVMLTMGSAYVAGAHANEIGDQDAAYNVGDVDDAAKRLYIGDVTVDPAEEADPSIMTNVVKLVNDEPGSETDITQSALRRAAVYGNGSYYLAQNSSELAEALLDVMNNIVLTTDTSFVAPVVPTSPENRTYSGERVYLGFFRPNSRKPWYGNLKKFGINEQNQIIDKNGDVATIESGEDAGKFISTAQSYWNDLDDAGLVEVGGAGEVLLAQSDRNVYTYLGTNIDLTNSANAFATTNTSITYNVLGLNDSADRDKLIDFVRGVDTWDDDGDLDTTDTRYWILGDILHSKPLVVNYNQYDFNATNEGAFTGSGVDTVCTTNKTIVYVGANDGMLHAFRDCNGSEAWAFVPPDLLDDLKLMPSGLQSQFNTSGAHTYFVDGSPTVYKYDADEDGNIESDDGDKVVIVFGLRRGGDSYYGLDVTDPEAPQFLWRISPDTIAQGTSTASSTDYGELGQSWSTPSIGVVKKTVSGSATEKVAAFIGAGYDNENEDGRFGATERYSNSDVLIPTEDYDDTVSDRVDNDPTGTLISGYVTNTRDDSLDAGNVVTNDPVGRGVYAIEIATLNSSGVPSFNNSGDRLWEFGFIGTDNGNGTDNAYNRKRMKHSFPSDITSVDTDFDGYVDRLYAGNTGGQVWRFCQYGGGDDGLRPQTSPLVETWIGKRIFEANGSGAGGKKFFYRPSITAEVGGQFNLYMGTGDRAHPLNLNVVDRLYGIFDKEQVTYELIDEDDLVDVTDDILQVDSETQDDDISTILTNLENSYGWYIELEQYTGEKVLANPLAFNKVAYYTTYSPDLSPPPDNCTPGNLGTSRLYAVDYLTGEAVLNFDEDNDPGNPDSIGNDRANDHDTGDALRRSDRVTDLGSGIPSGLVVLMPPGGDALLLIGCGGGLCSEEPVEGGTIIPIYWMSW